MSSILKFSVNSIILLGLWLSSHSSYAFNGKEEEIEDSDTSKILVPFKGRPNYAPLRDEISKEEENVQKETLDLFKSLPKEIKTHIFNFLDLPSICSAADTCKELRRFILIEGRYNIPHPANLFLYFEEVAAQFLYHPIFKITQREWGVIRYRMYLAEIFRHPPKEQDRGLRLSLTTNTKLQGIKYFNNIFSAPLKAELIGNEFSDPITLDAETEGELQTQIDAHFGFPENLSESFKKLKTYLKNIPQAYPFLCRRFIHLDPCENYQGVWLASYMCREVPVLEDLVRKIMVKTLFPINVFNFDEYIKDSQKKMAVQQNLMAVKLLSLNYDQHASKRLTEFNKKLSTYKQKKTSEEQPFVVLKEFERDLQFLLWTAYTDDGSLLNNFTKNGTGPLETAFSLADDSQKRLYIRELEKFGAYYLKALKPILPRQLMKLYLAVLLEAYTQTNDQAKIRETLKIGYDLANKGDGESMLKLINICFEMGEDKMACQIFEEIKDLSSLKEENGFLPCLLRVYGTQGNHEKILETISSHEYSKSQLLKSLKLIEKYYQGEDKTEKRLEIESKIDEISKRKDKGCTHQ